jgi:hypothetical protein
MVEAYFAELGDCDSAMTPQAMLKARFSELAESTGVALLVQRQTGKFYFVVTGEWENTCKFIGGSFPKAWMTSGAGPQSSYGLPLADVERVLAELQAEPAWLQRRDGASMRIAQQIREDAAFDQLPILADALEDGGCDNAAILRHCRSSGPHQRTCWVIELLLGLDRRRRGNARSD